MRALRVGVAMLLGVSGALMCAASWQRWAGVCAWGEVESRLCEMRQDHSYDFIAPSAPWEPVGDAAQLAGWSLLVLALVFVLLPWALSGHRPDLFSAAALVAAVVAMGVVGVHTLRSGFADSVVDPLGYELVVYAFLLLPFGLLVRFAVEVRGWPLAAVICLILASPLVAAFSYAVGSYDARPWWEAISGLLTASAGLSLLGAAAFSNRPRTHESVVTVASSAPTGGAASPG